MLRITYDRRTGSGAFNTQGATAATQSLLGVFSQIIRTEKIRGLWKGMTPVSYIVNCRKSSDVNNV